MIVEKDRMSIFSSIYFWPYALMQPFAGLLADVFEAGYIMGCASIIAGIGTIICGCSKVLGLSIFGRFITGFGTSMIYVPFSRVMTYWFDLKYYSILSGITMAVGGAGSMVSQTPLATFADKFGWRWAFYGIGIIGLFIGILLFFLVRSDPQAYGYSPVNGASPVSPRKESLKAELLSLFRNWFEVIKSGKFWLFALHILSSIIRERIATTLMQIILSLRKTFKNYNFDFKNFTVFFLQY